MALEAVENALNGADKPIYVLHEIVHNEYVVDSLKKRGVIFVDDLEEVPPGSTLVFSAHGVSRDTEEHAARLGLRVIDATCPLVKVIHRKAEELERESCRIILFGKRGHREVEGILGRIKSPVDVFESENELTSFVPAVDGREYACLSQTTLNADDVAEMTDIVRRKVGTLRESGGVCRATKDRQDAVKKLTGCCDTVIIVGSEKSSNTKRLCETALSCGAKSILVSGTSELDSSLLADTKNLGIASGASAPEELVRRILAQAVALGFEYSGEI